MRLEALGFAEVYDYAFGKVDWLAHNLPVEGERADPATAGRLMRNDVVRCAPGDRVADVLEAVGRSPYSFALVTDEAGRLLGRVRARRDGDAQVPVDEVMDLDPSTVRAHRSAGAWLSSWPSASWTGRSSPRPRGGCSGWRGERTSSAPLEASNAPLDRSHTASGEKAC